jgi:hypothetical protein
MAFRLQDLCKTTRRAAGNGLPRLFPRVLGDDRLDPRLGIAIRFFETHLGQPRGALDDEALMTLFGDPRLARGLIRCLARSYRYRDRPLADILGTERAAALTARGLGTSRDLRALAYRRANQAGGFVSPAHRADFLVHLVDDLEPTELEQVLWLDAADQAVLVREGSIPTAAIGLLPLSAASLAVEAGALRALAERLSCIILVPQEGPCDIPADLPIVPCSDGHLAMRLADCLERYGAGDTHNALPEWLAALIDGARAAGSLAESELARRLDCAEEEVGARLTPLTNTVGDMVYIDGFGLCTATLLEHARTLIDEETADNQGRLELTGLGRRLRRLVGRNEGLHALIAHLSGELRPVA